MYGAKSRGLGRRYLPMWQNLGKISLWEGVGSPGNFTGPGIYILVGFGGSCAHLAWPTSQQQE